ncbi:MULTISPECIES: hypothetical protein [unclassified Kaistella]|uniref:hypothetical protein n=1 Tax=unclassified Kaistella TaxID=2762626 RepID=UPI0027356E8B|nr:MULTISPECIES: hypothetical protein [unclassified Kaistella]MDP2452638.1 hypothetical protein [Kaistella sp. SH11-4b]MDP2455546.1 hypothetical protein [Kaistella sp. SH40-3]MDP2458450.1 hypothetical protein [Kaistella sp. SH19-2b]
MENPFSAMYNMMASIDSKLDQILGENSQTSDNSELLTKKEYLKIRKISDTTLWREEKRGQISAVVIGSKKYYKLPK